MTLNEEGMTTTASFVTSSLGQHTMLVSDWISDVCSSDLIVNEGTVIFTVKTTGSPSTTIGTATTSGTVLNGGASVSYPIPGGTAAGSYSIQARSEERRVGREC